MVRGSDLVGASYTGPFDELPAQGEVAHRIVAWDQVDGMEGTGVVHIAPGCGAEDFELARALELPVLAPLREDGTYLDGYGALTGKSFLEAHFLFRSLCEQRMKRISYLLFFSYSS